MAPRPVLTQKKIPRRSDLIPSHTSGKARIEAPMREARSSPRAHRGARVIGTDAAYLPGIAELRRKARAGSEDNPNVNAHQSSPLMGKSTIETIHEVRLKQFCARLREGLSRPVNPQELKRSRRRRHATAALFLFRPADNAQRVPRSPYCQGAGSNLEIFSKAMASNLAA